MHLTFFRIFNKYRTSIDADVCWTPQTPDPTKIFVLHRSPKHTFKWFVLTSCCWCL